MKGPNIQSDVAALTTVVNALEPLNEQQRSWVLQTAASRFSQTTLTVFSPAGSPPAAASVHGATRIQDGKVTSAKDFIRQKSPQTDVQRITCLAYYLANFRDSPRFKTKHLSELNTEANSPKLSNPTVAVNNARKERYLSPVGNGEKQLTTDGEDLVDALPDQEKVRALRSGRRARSKRVRKTK